MSDTSKPGFSLSGLPPSKGWMGLRGNFQFIDADLIVTVSGFKTNGKERVRYEATFRFQVDPVELGAAMVLALALREDALFHWQGQAEDDGSPWFLRTYWFLEPWSKDSFVSNIEQIESFLDQVKEGFDKVGEEGLEQTRKVLDKLKSRISQEPFYAISLEPVMLNDESQAPIKFIYPLDGPSTAVIFAESREAAMARPTIRLVGGVRVAVQEGMVGVAAGNSRVLVLNPEQRTGIRMVLQRAIEDRKLSIGFGKVSFFAPLPEGSLWKTGLRMRILGRTAPINSPRDAAKLLVVL